MKTTKASYSLICLIFLLAIFLHSSLSQLCNLQDKDTLLQIKKEFNNPDVLGSWSLLTDCCNWDYVECDDAYRITSLIFIDVGLAGPIPAEVGNLPFLEVLDFNQIPGLIGSIPNTFAYLQNLRFLTITMTNVGGPIPDFIGDLLKKLEFIDLSNNNFSGPIPRSIGLLPVLGGLRLDRNKLTGGIPETFGEFKADDFYLYLSNNQLSGEIPLTLEKKDFTYIDISNNRLEGDPRPLFATKKSMQLIDLSGNLFLFDLSKVEFPRTLIFLDLSENKIYGHLPEELTELTNLKSFNVSYNRICGKIPVGGKLQKFGPSAYFHNDCLCGAPLESCTSLRKIITFGLCFVECILADIIYPEVLI